MSVDFESLGDQCKAFEAPFTSPTVLKGNVLMARLDGRAFHTLARGFDKPYDKAFMSAMQGCTGSLVRNFHANAAYTQSDEISLAWVLSGEESQFPFGGKTHKLNSILAAHCAVVFGKYLNLCWDLKIQEPITFDCRTWAVPSKELAADTFLWRQMDATRNSINMLASHHFSPKQLHGMGTNDRLKMLEEKGIRWNEEDEAFKNGTFVFKVREERELTPFELTCIPEGKAPVGTILRSKIVSNNQQLSKLEDKVGFLFKKEKPE